MVWQSFYLDPDGDAADRVLSTVTVGNRNAVEVPSPVDEHGGLRTDIAESHSLTSPLTGRQFTYILPKEDFIQSMLQGLIDADRALPQPFGILEPSDPTTDASKLHKAIVQTSKDFESMDMSRNGHSKKATTRFHTNISFRITRFPEHCRISVDLPPRLTIQVTASQENSIDGTSSTTGYPVIDRSSFVNRLVRHEGEVRWATAPTENQYRDLLSDLVTEHLPGDPFMMSHGCSNVADLAAMLSENDMIDPVEVEAEDFDGNSIKVRIPAVKVW